MIEILSPSDSLPELDARMRQWIENVVRLVWRIDPFPLNRPETVEGACPLAGFQI